MEMLDKFNDAGVRAIFAGHWHRNGGGTYKNVQLIVSGPVGMKFLNHEDNDETIVIILIVWSAIGMPLGEDASGIRIVDVS